MALAVPEPLLPEVPLMFVFLLFVLAIIFLMLCTSCKRESFDLPGITNENMLGSQIHVIKLEEIQDGYDCPTGSYLNMDEIVVGPAPGNDVEPTSIDPNNIIDTGNTIQDGMHYNRPSTDPVTYNLREQRIPVKREFEEAPALLLTPQQEEESTFQTGCALVTPSQSDNPSGIPPLSHVSITPQNPSLQHLHSPDQVSFNGLTEDRKPPSLLCPSSREELYDPAYCTVNELKLPDSHLILPNNVSDSQPVGRTHFLNLEEEQNNLDSNQLNAVYAQVSKKNKTLQPLTPQSQSLEDAEEEDGIAVEDPAPPVPERTFNLEDN